MAHLSFYFIFSFLSHFPFVPLSSRTCVQSQFCAPVSLWNLVGSHRTTGTLRAPVGRMSHLQTACEASAILGLSSAEELGQASASMSGTEPHSSTAKGNLEARVDAGDSRRRTCPRHCSYVLSCSLQTPSSSSYSPVGVICAALSGEGPVRRPESRGPGPHPGSLTPHV